MYISHFEVMLFFFFVVFLSNNAIMYSNGRKRLHVSVTKNVQNASFREFIYNEGGVGTDVIVKSY